MNGDKGHVNPYLRYTNVAGINAIFWYMDLGSSVAADVNGGTFWTYDSGSISFTLGKSMEQTQTPRHLETLH